MIPTKGHPDGDEQCTEYILTFDETKRLTAWIHQDCP